MGDARCVICDLPGYEVCSYECLEASVREREENVAVLHRLRDTPASRTRRRDLERRNGRITSALMGWRQHHGDPVDAAQA